MTDFPEAAAPRAPWLMTLADLALLLLGFMVLMQATGEQRRAEITQGLREAFGSESTPIPVAAHAARFAPGSAELGRPAALVTWIKAELRDPRVAITVTGSTDGTPGDVDQATRSVTLLAADRARAVAAVLSGVVPPSRIRLATDPTPRGRLATVTLAFAGERP